MFWDDEESPSVEAPFGDFFGNGFGVYKPFYSLFLKNFLKFPDYHQYKQDYFLRKYYQSRH